MSHCIMKSCRYCSQLKTSQTALNRHIRHSPRCYEAYTRHLAHISNVRNLGRHTDDRADLHHHLLLDKVDTKLGASGCGWEVSSDGDIIDNHEPFQFPDNPLHPSSPDFHPQLVTVNIPDIEDHEGAPRKPPQYKKSYPGSVAKVLGIGQTVFEKLRQEQVSLGENAWAPFASAEEWDLSRWLMTNAGQNVIDQFLKLTNVS